MRRPIECFFRQLTDTSCVPGDHREVESGVSDEGLVHVPRAAQVKRVVCCRRVDRHFAILRLHDTAHCNDILHCIWRQLLPSRVTQERCHVGERRV